jgi:hypothetical protein
MITPSFSITATERVLPRLALDFTTAALDPRITFTRASTATRTNSSGLIETVAINAPRFDYNPITLASLGLLIEEQRTNLVLRSAEFDDAVWTKGTGNPTISSNVVVAPDGSLSADKFVEGTANGSQGIGQTVTVPTSAISYSVFAKKDERYKILLREATTTGWSGLFDIDSGTVLDTEGGGNVSTQITAVGNGWYKCVVNFASIAGSSRLFRIVVAPDNATTVATANSARTGDGTSGIYIWGAQLEAGAFPTSYIPTTTTALTRNADVATMTGTNFSDFWQASKGGAQVLATPSTVSGIRPLVQFDDNTANEIIALRGNTTNPELYIVDGGTPQAQLDAGTIATNTAYSLTGWWQENNSFAQLNTQASVRDNTVTIPTVTQAKIGSDGTNYLNGTIAAIYYYDELANSIYDSLRLLGYTGTVTDMLLQYYLARGATSNSLTDAEIEFLGVKGFTTGTIDDRWTNYLISLGYSGTITDMKYQYWKSPE